MMFAEVKATLTAFGTPPSEVAARLVRRNPGERAARAAAGVGLFWGLAVIALFIPVAHLILVPTFIVAGLVVGIRRAREDVSVATAKGVCPRCGVSQEFTVGGRFTGERAVDCPSCHNQLRLVMAEFAKEDSRAD